MFDLTDITIRSISVSETDNNVYLLTHKASGRQVLIDAADDADAIKSMLEEARSDTPQTPQVTHIITTHSHWDHVRALGEMVEYTGATTAAGSEDVSEIEIPTDMPLEAGTIHTGDLELEIIKLRGHTPGSVAVLYRDPEGPDHLFSGDSLFPGGVGNTFGDADRFASLFNDVVERVFNVLPDETIVHPGHGARTTLGEERPHLAEWRARGW